MMPPDLFPAILLFASGSVCLAVVFLLYRRSPDAPGAWAMMIWLSGLAWWDITYAIFWTGAPAPVPFFWLDVTLVGAYIVPAAALVFAMDFAKYWGKFRKPIILVLCIEPVIVFILQWTDPLHHLYFGGLRMLNTTSILLAGPVWRFNVNYSYILILITVLIHVVRFFRTSGMYRLQVGLILIAIILPWTVNILAVTRLGVVWPFDATPFLFTVAALPIALGISRYHLLDLMPIAQNLVLENMGDGVVVMDLQGRIVEINPACEAWLGRSRRSIYGETGEQVFARWPMLIEGLKNLDLAHKDILIDEATQRWLEVRMSPLHDRQDQKIGSLIIARDISQRKQDQRALKAAHDELEVRVQERTAQLRDANLSLEKALKAKDEFLSTISHELRTPLTSILGLAELLQMPHYGTLSDKQHRATLTIQNSGQRLLKLINDVLDYTKLQASDVPLEFQPCSLGILCRSVQQTLAPQASKKGQQTQVDLVPEEIIVRTDVPQLQKLLQHLLENAAKFTPEGGQFGIRVMGDTNAGLVYITVWDTGIGILEQDLPRLFQPFVQMDGSLTRQYDGVGLGLALARQRAELLGGKIEVESAPAKGSQFTVTLPWN